MQRARVFRALNWKYALGKVALIMVGILLALAASDWFRGRQLIAEEREILMELRIALSEDTVVLENALEETKEASELVVALLDHLDAGGAYSPELDHSFGVAYGLRLVPLNRAAFESLKSRGLGLIRDVELRSEIARHYATTYAAYDLAQVGQRSVILEALRPYFLKHFRDLDFNNSATPLDYEALKQDVVFRNLLDYRLQVLNRNDISSFQSSLDGAVELMESIDRALAD